MIWLAAAFRHFVDSPRILGFDLRLHHVLLVLTSTFAFQLSGQAVVTDASLPPLPGIDLIIYRGEGSVFASRFSWNFASNE